jgi:hypothetical protein
MSTLRSYALLAAALLVAISSFADQKPAQSSAPGPMTKETRFMVIRSLNAETVFVRKPLPRGEKGVTLKDGKISPSEDELRMALAQFGFAAKPGDRALITNVDIRSDRIRFEINGGPKKKKKWYQHIEVGGMGGMTQVAPDKDDPNNPNAQKGSYVDLVFDKYVPEMTGDQIRDLLSPLLDFHAKSAAEAFLDTVPPKVKEAIKNHEVLVGMNREMVGYAKGRPAQKIREKDDQGKDFEDWMYGQPPQEVAFIRFVGDEVVRVETMKVDGTKLVRTEKEVDVAPMGVTVAKKEEEKKPRPANAPTLRRPGEKPELDTPDASGKAPMPRTTDPPPTTPPGSGPIL